MVFSNKPLQFLVVLTLAFLPLISLANGATEGEKVNTELKQGSAVAHEGVTEEPQDVKSEIKEFINHHLLYL